MLQMVEIMERESHERVKILVLLCAEEDVATRRAAAGALAMLTSKSEKISKKIRDCVRIDAFFRTRFRFFV